MISYMTIHTECPAPSPPPTTPLTLTTPPENHHHATHDDGVSLFLSKLPEFVVLTNFVRDGCVQNVRSYFPLLVLLLFFMPPATAQQQQYPFAKVKGDKTMAIILLILVILFFALGIVSIYIRQCADRRLRGRLDLAILAAAGGRVGSSQRQRGLVPAVVDSFPTFAYSAVKDLKIGRVALECAVCLSEFRDDETLRLIPQCCHVFHPDCISVWLSSHSTCPVCRANLALKPGDTSSPSSLGINVSDQPDLGPDHNDPNLVSRVNDDDRNTAIITESQSQPERSTPNLDDESRPVRPFPHFNSTGHSPIQPGENFEQFTLRLPDEVRDRLMNAGSLSRTTSCGVTFQSERSGRRDYRMRSVGRSERFGSSGRLDRLGFTWTPPFVGRTGSMRSTKETKKASSVAVDDEVDVGERSCDLLFPKGSRSDD